MQAQKQAMPPPKSAKEGMKVAPASPMSIRPALPGAVQDDPVLVALQEAEERLQGKIRAGLDRQAFVVAQALHDAIGASREVVKALRSA